MKTRMLPFLLAIAALAGACGSSYDRADFVEEMTEDGSITEDQANCMADGIEEEFSIERLEGTGDLTAEEEEVLTSLAISCVLGG